MVSLSRSGDVRSPAGVRAGRIDIEDEARIAAAVGQLVEGAPLRFILVATGLLDDVHLMPEQTYRALDPEHLARSFPINAVGPALVAKHVLPLMPDAGKSIFAVLSAGVGSIEDNRLGGWYSYRASKAALNQLMRTFATEAQPSKAGSRVHCPAPWYGRHRSQSSLSGWDRNQEGRGILFPRAAAGCHGQSDSGGHGSVLCLGRANHSLLTGTMKPFLQEFRCRLRAKV